MQRRLIKEAARFIVTSVFVMLRSREGVDFPRGLFPRQGMTP